MPPSLSETEEVILKGHKAHVAAARDYIVSRMAQAQTLQSLAIHNIPKDKHKYIVGPKGAGVAGIYAATGVTVTVPEATLLPAMLVATTEQVYAVPLVNPVTVSGEVRPVAVKPPALHVTV